LLVFTQDVAETLKKLENNKRGEFLCSRGCENELPRRILFRERWTYLLLGKKVLVSSCGIPY